MASVTDETVYTTPLTRIELVAFKPKPVKVTPFVSVIVVPLVFTVVGTIRRTPVCVPALVVNVSAVALVTDATV